jgi:hypothetical protein
MPDKGELINVPLSVPAAQLLLHWLTVVPEDVIPVTHPAERQALADLLTALESAAVYPDAAAREQASELLTRASGDWIRRGPVYRPTTDP